jgi:hypothetical protein
MGPQKHPLPASSIPISTVSPIEYAVFILPTMVIKAELSLSILQGNDRKR